VPKFDFDVAWQIGSLVRDLGLTRVSPIVVDVRSLGQPLFYSALRDAGARPDVNCGAPDRERRDRNAGDGLIMAGINPFGKREEELAFHLRYDIVP
jgi:hypothetical protein